MIKVLDANGNCYQLPSNQVRTTEDLKMQLLNLFQLPDPHFEIYFNKKQLNINSLLPTNNTEHPFIIISKPDKYTIPKFNTQNISKGRFDHLFLKNSIIPSENLNDFSPHSNFDSSSSDNSDFVVGNGPLLFNMDDIYGMGGDYLNHFDFINLDEPFNPFIDDYDSPISYSQDSLDENINPDVSSSDLVEFVNPDDGDDDDDDDDDEANFNSTEDE